MMLRLMPTRDEDITGLIHLWQTGDRDAETRLFEIVLPDLRRIAHSLMRRERRDHTLQATELVSQIYVKLVMAKDRTWTNRGHFFALAARAMRNYLVDYARRRPNAEFMPIDSMPFDRLPALRRDPDSLLNLNRLLEQLAFEDPEACSIVELKYFLGVSDAEAAEILGIKLRSLQRRWQDARRWLYVKLRGVDAGAQGT